MTAGHEAVRSNLVEVDLSRREVRKSETAPSLVRALLGGRGLNMYYLHRRIEPGIDPLAPENVLLFGPGILTGTGVPNSSRMNVTARSPEARFLADANCGGFFGAALRLAGVDRLLVSGRSDAPCYLYVEDGEVEIRDASPYWGLNTRELQRRLRRDLGRDIQVACIGVAGEKLVRFASVMNNLKNAAGRGGLGAVMGSKNLKAVVARGRGSLPLAHPDEFLPLVREIRDHLYRSKVIQVLGRVGTPLLYEVSNHLGTIRTHNSQLNAFESTLDAEEVHRYVEKMLSCYGCVVHCRHRNRGGGEGPEYTTLGLLGANVGIADPARVIELNNLANDLGLDVSSTGTMIAWAMELSDRDLLQARVNGRRLTFGDFEAVRTLMHDISERRGLGDVLAESSRAAARLGDAKGDYLIAVKGLPQSDPHDVRYIKSFALGIATASRGADHLRSRPTLDVFMLPEELTTRIYGRKIDPDPTSYDTKEVLVAFHENIYAVIDCLGICKFVCHGFNSPQLLDYGHFSRLLRVVTGLELSAEELVEVGRRVVDLERLINLRQGLTRADDTLPRRYFDDEMSERLAKGHRIERVKFEEMLDRYYAIRGWDEEGQLAPSRLRELEALGT